MNKVISILSKNVTLSIYLVFLLLLSNISHLSDIMTISSAVLYSLILIIVIMIFSKIKKIIAPIIIIIIGINSAFMLFIHIYDSGLDITDFLLKHQLLSNTTASSSILSFIMQNRLQVIIALLITFIPVIITFIKISSKKITLIYAVLLIVVSLYSVVLNGPFKANLPYTSLIKKVSQTKNSIAIYDQFKIFKGNFTKFKADYNKLAKEQIDIQKQQKFLLNKINSFSDKKKLLEMVKEISIISRSLNETRKNIESVSSGYIGNISRTLDDNMSKEKIVKPKIDSIKEKSIIPSVDGSNEGVSKAVKPDVKPDITGSIDNSTVQNSTSSETSINSTSKESPKKNNTSNTTKSISIL